MIKLGIQFLKERKTQHVGLHYKVFLRSAWRHLDAAGDDAAALAARRRSRHLQEHRRLAAALCGVVIQGGSRRSACAQEAPPLASAPAGPLPQADTRGRGRARGRTVCSGIAAVHMLDILQSCVLREVPMAHRRWADGRPRDRVHCVAGKHIQDVERNDCL